MDIFEPQIRELIYTALAEDIKGGDITTGAITASKDPFLTAEVVLKSESCVVCGLYVFKTVFDILSRGEAKIKFLAKEGGAAAKNGKILSLRARASVILSGERTALNFLQHLSGIATAAKTAANELKGLKTKILDTRKTLPGLRLLQKYAVKTGGGNNHRFDLSSGILAKDNHIKLAGGIKKALKMIKNSNQGFNMKIEVETSSVKEVREALEAGADIIMFDNMDIADMKKAVGLIDGKALTEASGNIKLNNLRKIARETGVDYISMGWLTNSVVPADFSLNITNGIH